MIPRRLRLRNFLSYRDCEIAFTGLHVAALSGRNGAGKSALLDAITWALWGQARGRVEDERIHGSRADDRGEGAAEMHVDLEFECGGDVYRVIRKRTRGRSSGALDCFQVDERGRRRAISGGTMRETQAELNRRLHMDHATFVNSAFLVQGRANEFTTQTPARRKEVLRKVLDLDRYEELAKLANERRRAAETEAAVEERRLEGDLEALDERPAIEEQLAAVGRERAETGERLAGASREADELRLAAAGRARRERAASEAGDRLAAAAKDAERRADAIAELEGELAAVRATLDRADELERDHERLLAAREEERALAERAAAAAAIERAMSGAEREIAAERARLETGAAAADEQVGAAAALVAGLPALLASEEALGTERDRIAALDADAERERDAASEGRRLHAAREAEARGHRDRAQELKDRQETLERAEGEALCPVCGKPLSAAELAETVAGYAAERKQLGGRYDEALAEANAAEASATEHEGRAAELQRERDALDTRTRARERQLAASLAGARDAERDLPALERGRDGIRARLDAGDFAGDARARLDAERARLDALGYDRGAHEDARARLDALDAVDPAFRELLRARERADGLGERIKQAREEQRLAGEALEAARASLAEARAALEATEDVAERLEAAEAVLAECEEHARALDHRHGALVERRDGLDRLAARVEEARGRLAAARETAALHAELARALGRDGVQAMLIEQAIPELESAANALLDRMTDGAIRVSLATQRASASGQTRETLDIRIADGLGERGYEMYSGGEAFRVDFALRIALSRLLAARSGAALPTLIIDEGFGTQDAEGIDRLVDAIAGIGDEFRLILLVTHIEELKERFERRIEVEKDAERGSIARVV